MGNETRPQDKRYNVELKKKHNLKDGDITISKESILEKNQVKTSKYKYII